MSIADTDIASSAIFDLIHTGLSKMPEAELKGEMKKVNGIFEMKVKNAKGKEGVWTIDMKKEGKVYKGPAKPKADVTISLSDETFQQLADGKLKCAPLLNDLCAFKTQRRLPIADTRLTIHPRCIPPSPTPERPSRILALYSGQKAFMSGKLKVKGNIMLATKLDTVLKGAQAKL